MQITKSNAAQFRYIHDNLYNLSSLTQKNYFFSTPDEEESFF